MQYDTCNIDQNISFATLAFWYNHLNKDKDMQPQMAVTVCEDLPIL